MLEIEKAGTAQIDIIQQLTYAIWPEAYKEILKTEQLAYMLELIYSKQALTNQIEDLGHMFIVVYDENIPVGFASYSPKSAENNSVYRLNKLYMLPNQQGKGTGKFLLNYVIDQIKNAGVKTLELNVNRQNKAIHFYKKIGFFISKEEDIDIGGGYFMNDYVMSLEL
ncbi:MAG: GNAT family N-acetyltransferase [Ferruginibacter sp.]